MMFCLDDGAELLYGPASMSEPRTAILHKTAPAGEGNTLVQGSFTDPTAVMPSADMQAKTRSKVPLVIASVVILLAIGGTAWYLIPRKPLPPGANMQISKLVSGLKGIPGDVSISPDGKYVAYSLYEDGKSGLWLRQISQETSIPIVPAAEGVKYAGVTFSPDNELVYFVSTRRPETSSTLYSVPVLGGREPKKLRQNLGRRWSLSPDANDFTFVRSSPQTREEEIFVARTDGSGEERKIASRSGDEWFESIAWSPDGKYIACGTGTSKGGYSGSIVLVPSIGGDPVPLGTHRFGNGIDSLRWLADGTGLIAISALTTSAKSAVWHISYPDGAAHRITNDLNGYYAADVSADGKTAVMGYGDFYSRVWIVGPDGAAKRITNGRDDGLGGVAYLNDGRIIYTSHVNDENNLWVMDADGSGARALTNGDTGAGISPIVVSPDGNSVVFESIRPDNVSHIWRVNVDGTGLKQLTNTEGFGAMFSRDGQWIIFTGVSPTRRLWKMPAAGGEAVPLTDITPAYDAAGFSEDGKLVSCRVLDNTSDPPRVRSALIELETGKLAGYIDVPPLAGTANFSPDGREYIYMEARAGVVNLWAKPVSGGSARQVTKFTEAFIDRFAVAPDGKSFAVTHSEGTNEIVIARNFR
jgi:Tol biopolymer transport system component